jgi:type I restriction enzyme S subunit
MHSAWTKAKLGGVARVLASNVDKHIHQDEIPVKLCNYLDVYRNRRLSKPYEFSPGSVTQSEADRFTIKKGDVLITKDSETPDDIGVPCLIADEFENTVCGYHLALIRPGKGLNSGFLSHLFQSEAARRYFLAKAAGLTRFGLNARTIRGLPIPLPQPAEQTAIAGALDAIEFAMLNALGVIAKAERLQKGLMQQLLTGRLMPDGTPRKPDEFQETKLGLLPKTWTPARIKDFGEVSTGKTPPTANEANFGGEFQFITPGDLGTTKWLRQTERSLSALGAESAGVLLANTVCVVCIGATIGKVGLTVRPACTNQQINSVVCRQNHSPEYLYYALRHRAQHLLVIAGVNATPQLNKSDFSKYRIPMPATPEEESEIGVRLAVFDELVEVKKEKIAALQLLKKSLMQNLLTGRIRLPVASAPSERPTA